VGQPATLSYLRTKGFPADRARVVECSMPPAEVFSEFLNLGYSTFINLGAPYSTAHVELRETPFVRSSTVSTNQYST